MSLATIPEAVAEIAAGRMVIIVDDEDRENEGDLVMAAEKVTPEAVNFMSKYGRGLICLAINGERLDELRIPPMVSDNTSRHGTAFGVSIEAKKGVTTGISAHDRAFTIKAVLDPETRPDDLARPGHTFPIRARDGGVLVRAGHTETAVDMARMAGLYPAGIICEIVADDGTMARLPSLREMADRFGLKIASVADLIAHRRRNEKLVQRVATARLPTRYGMFTAHAYRSLVDADEQVALVCSDVTSGESVLVRVHSECLTGDVFGSLRCDCGEQIGLAMELIADEGSGVFLYMRQEGRGIGFHNKLRAYALQDEGMDTVEANHSLGFATDLRDYGVGAQILADLGVTKLRLLTNNPKKVVGLGSYGITVEATVPIIAPPNPHNRHYLETKQRKMGHHLGIEEIIS